MISIPPGGQPARPQPLPSMLPQTIQLCPLLTYQPAPAQLPTDAHYVVNRGLILLEHEHCGDSGDAANAPAATANFSYHGKVAIVHHEGDREAEREDIMVEDAEEAGGSMDASAFVVSSAVLVRDDDSRIEIVQGELIDPPNHPRRQNHWFWKHSFCNYFAR